MTGARGDRTLLGVGGVVESEDRVVAGRDERAPKATVTTDPCYPVRVRPRRLGLGFRGGLYVLEFDACFCRKGLLLEVSEEVAPEELAVHKEVERSGRIHRSQCIHDLAQAVATQLHRHAQ